MNVRAVDQVGIKSDALPAFFAILKTLLNGFQRRFFASQLVGGAFKIPVVADIILHRRDVDARVTFADKLGDEFLNVVIWIEGDRLFQQVSEFLAQSAQETVDLVAVGFPGIKKASFPDAAALKKLPELWDVQRHTRCDKMVVGDLPDIFKEACGFVVRRIHIEDAAEGQAAALHVVVPLRHYVARKPSAAQIAIAAVGVVAQLSAKIAVQGARALTACGFIEIPSCRIAEQHQLQGVDDGRFSRRVDACHVIELFKFDHLVREIVPVNQQQFFQHFHPCCPP